MQVSHLNGVSIIEEDGRVVFAKKCTVTGKAYSVIVDKQRYSQWRNGALIQNCFPDLNAEEREFMISGHTPAEWNNLFSGE